MKAWQWRLAHHLAQTSTPHAVVEWLRLTQPCTRCGARPMQGCRRGLGEVNATHLQRGA